jgi:hypothetical protein
MGLHDGRRGQYSIFVWLWCRVDGGRLDEKCISWPFRPGVLRLALDEVCQTERRLHGEQRVCGRSVTSAGMHVRHGSWGESSRRVS